MSEESGSSRDREDVSRPPAELRYRERRDFYRREDVAEAYDERRWGTPKRVRRNRRKWETIRRAMARAPDARSVLDLPCGTGRFTGHLAREGCRVIGTDISVEMMRVARDKLDPPEQPLGFVQADAEALPLASDAVDGVVSIRFFLHVDPETRLRILREFARVARRWVIVDYRHRYTIHYLRRRLKRKLGFDPGPYERVSGPRLREEIGGAGLRLVEIFPVVDTPIARWFSEKWIVLAEVTGPGP